ncbi:MAG: hydroxymethylglutaryl-CoA synthase [Bacteroidota bacterium]
MDNHNNQILVGIDDMVAYLPALYLPIETLAEKRAIEYAKLNKGLGLKEMSFPDVHEDAATMAANAVLKLILQNELNPRSIGRIYVGTESATDGSKPVASYVLGMLTEYLAPVYGEDCMTYCDVVDLTFACIGAVDAIQNTTDWIAGGSNRMGIVVGSDIAKYELESTGEYTQGAGAVACLIKANPRLIAFNKEWGVATKDVHDFFKPVRQITKAELVDEVLKLAGINGITAEGILGKLNGHIDNQAVVGMPDAVIHLHKETPVFDGPYSNDCYQERIKQALTHFACMKGIADQEEITKDWSRLIFHLPYAYQARRMYPEIYIEEAKKRGELGLLEQQIEMEAPVREQFENEEDFNLANKKFIKAVSKSPIYRAFVKDKIEKGERASSRVGNLYTSSILLSIMSTLEADLQEDNSLEGKVLGFFAYGSGSKSKVFEGVVQDEWAAVTERFKLTDQLDQRQAIDYSTYESLHRGKLKAAVNNTDHDVFYLKEIHTQRDNQEGARMYAAKKSISNVALR